MSAEGGAAVDGDVEVEDDPHCCVAAPHLTLAQYAKSMLSRVRMGMEEPNEGTGFEMVMTMERNPKH